MPSELADADRLRAADRGDRARLQRFVCTDPSKKQWIAGHGKYHPRPWELDVQSWLRNLSAPLTADDESLIVVVGEDDEIRAACHYGFNSEGTAVVIFAIACSIECCGQGYAKALLDAVLALCRRDAPTDPVIARIHFENEASKAVFSAAGFVETSERAETEPSLVIWTYEHAGG